MDTYLQFGPFRLMPQRRLLMEGERPLKLGGRAFDLLVTLVERAGMVVPNADLMAKVWQDTIVEPGSLRMHIAALRKALGDGAGARYIVNVPLKGYTFVAEVTQFNEPEPDRAATPPPPLDVPARAENVPALLVRMVGREGAVDDIIRRMPRNRCVSLVGAGGIGKTTLALATAHGLEGAYQHGVVFVELAEVVDARRVPSALASALGVALLPSDPIQGLAAFLRDKHCLVVLDNCEHVIAQVAVMVEQLLSEAQGLHVLVTSREPMRIPGEWVQRLASLESPTEWRNLSSSQALAYPAVQLFVERASASLDTFALEAEDVASVCELCHRLDGLPLAIEIAAASVDRLGLRGLIDTLGSHLTTLMKGRRTALPRHQTLRAALDWSHDLLAPSEKVLFRRLSIFAGAFTLPAVIAVCGHPDGDGSVELADVALDLSSLVGKSLVSADISGSEVLYRLLEISREYARELLASFPEADDLRRRHAAHMLEVFSEAERTRATGSLQHWQARYAPQLGDLRVALAWSFAPGGDVALGVSLAAASAPVWFDFSLMAEFREVAEQALALMRDQPGLSEAVPAMKIHEAYGHALWHTRGGGPAMAETFSRALLLAQKLDSPMYQQRAIWGLWLICNTTGDSAGSVRLAEQFGQITGPGTDESGPTHHRMMALGQHFHGEQARACHHAQRVLDHQSVLNRIAQNSGFQFDQRVAALTVLARSLWIHGYPDQALRRGEQAVSEALNVGHALSLCYALANGAIPAAFWAGDLAAASRYTRLLLARSTEHSLVFWQAFGEGYDLLLAPDDDIQALSKDGAMAALKNPATSQLLLDTLCTIDGRLFGERMLDRVGVSGWCAAEMLRLKGSWVLRGNSVEDRRTARTLFEEGVNTARRQEARSWELRCLESLARLDNQEGVTGPWAGELQALAKRFTEGRESKDHRRVEALLASWGVV